VTDTLHDALAAAAVDAGDVPAHVAEWVDDGAHPDPCPPGADVVTVAQVANLWQITDVGAATWAMRRVAAARTELVAVDERYERERKVLDDWRETAGRRHKRTEQFMVERLTAWAVKCREAAPKQATWTTPAGKVTTRAPSVPWTVEVANREALLDYALAYGNDRLVRPALATLTAIRAAVVVAEKDDGPVAVDPATGEVVPGLFVEPSRTTATVVVG